LLTLPPEAIDLVGPVSADVVGRIREELATGAGTLTTAKALGVGTGTVHRVKRSMIAVGT
jgi:hypothetical protein